MDETRVATCSNSSWSRRMSRQRDTGTGLRVTGTKAVSARGRHRLTAPIQVRCTVLIYHSLREFTSGNEWLEIRRYSDKQLWLKTMSRRAWALEAFSTTQRSHKWRDVISVSGWTILTSQIRKSLERKLPTDQTQVAKQIWIYTHLLRDSLSKAQLKMKPRSTKIYRPVRSLKNSS